MVFVIQKGAGISQRISPLLACSAGNALIDYDMQVRILVVPSDLISCDLSSEQGLGLHNSDYGLVRCNYIPQI